jgi:hypothetical protein
MPTQRSLTPDLLSVWERLNREAQSKRWANAELSDGVKVSLIRYTDGRRDVILFSTEVLSPEKQAAWSSTAIEAVRMFGIQNWPRAKTDNAFGATRIEYREPAKAA